MRSFASCRDNSQQSLATLPWLRLSILIVFSAGPISSREVSFDARLMRRMHEDSVVAFNDQGLLFLVCDSNFIWLYSTVMCGIMRGLSGCQTTTKQNLTRGEMYNYYSLF